MSGWEKRTSERWRIARDAYLISGSMLKLIGAVSIFVGCITLEKNMRRYLFAAAIIGAIATPALADDVGVGVRAGPAGAGVSVGQSPDYRDRDRDRTTVIKEREPRDKTVIKKESDDGTRSKTVIHDRN
jgi:hypothetical protein